ncbi:metal ABC transporter solute-binding protein, Zn/Mn family [Halomarina halobia]|uniref:Metal ABC transporter solute-binding protein, Zn/Mn family n=1 Tax=Halomarina halobia TaxID=3033386 RepID=A0ABD6A5X5_9EURY|nr:metal ABC transporter substrate-binding protein [Halomarina sp. PSR21]
MAKLTRRSLLASGATVTAGALAGCLGSVDPATGSNENGVEASFYVLGDFGRRVGGDALDVGTLVPFGQHGHGWQPSADLQRRVREARAFLYMGEGFQPWADDVVRSLGEDGVDVAIIAARDNVDLIDAAGDGGHDHDHDHDHGDENGTHEGENESGTRDEGGHDHEGEHDHGDENDTHGGDIHEGEHGENGSHREEGDEEADGHDRGGKDPHFWLDPTRAATAVETIRDGFVDLAPDEGATLRENADGFVSELRDLDAEFEEALSGRSKGAVLVAGHNAFQYLGERYGFAVHALTDLSPDDSPTTSDVRRAREIIAADDIEHVLAPVFESDRAAKQLVAETDATEVLPITALAGYREEWEEQDWGYVEVMREINLKSLRTALGA